MRQLIRRLVQEKLSSRKSRRTSCRKASGALWASSQAFCRGSEGLMETKEMLCCSWTPRLSDCAELQITSPSSLPLLATSASSIIGTSDFSLLCHFHAFC